MKRLTLLLTCLFVSMGFLVAQTTKVTGVVYDESGEPVIGAAIQVKENPSIGTTTDLDGKFELNVSSEYKKLTISSIGMKSQEVSVKPNLSIRMAPDTQVLQEVVVTGMMRQDKRTFSGAATRIDADKVKLDGVPDASRALDGRVAGVTVQNVSGTFGTAPKVRVRGATSIYGSSKPLWVVDGVIMEDAVEVSADQLSSGDAVTLISSAISGLNADDIESFQILKDGSATSIYGARAMAGVIVVTTKKGEAGKSRINYTGELTFRLKPSYRDFNISNSQEQMGIYKEMFDKGWLEFASIANNSASGVYGHMYQLINTFNQQTGRYELEHSQSAMNAYLREAEFRNTDWFDLLFKNSIMQSHAVSVSSGNEKARYYASLSALYDPGWYESSSVQRYTANANASFNLSKNVTLNLLTNGSYRKQKAPGTLSQEVDVVSGAVKRNFDINPYSYALNTSRTLDPNVFYTRNYASFNIFHELENNYIDLNVSDLKFQGELNWKIIPGLEIGGLAAIRYQSSSQDHHVKDQSNQALAYRAGIDPVDATIRELNPFLYTDPENPNALPETVLPEGGIYFKNDYSLFQADFRGTVTYNKAFGANEQHILSLFGGGESNVTDRNAIYFQGWGFVYDNGGMPFVDPGLFKQQTEEGAVYYGNEWFYGRSVAAFATGTYSYDRKYSATLTGRYEGTNRLGKSRSARWLPTWNISGAWNMHEEKFFDKVKSVLSHSTIRLSYSLNGERAPSFVTNALVVYRPIRPWRPLSSASEPGMEIEDLENSELTYEKKHEINFGMDLGFLDNRINFVFDIYKRNNYDLIGLIYTQGAGGSTAKYANVAAMESKGLEATLSTKNISTKDFTWSTDFTFSWTNNEITDLKSRANMISLVRGTGFVEGYSQRSLFSIPFVGLNEEGLPTFINQDGEVTVSDIEFQEFQDLDFLKYEGPIEPTITGGLGNVFTYRDFRLNLFFTYSFGNFIRLDPVFAASYSDLSALPKEFKNRWTLPGDEAYTTIPVIASRRQYFNNSQLEYAYNAYNYSTERVAKGDFIRLKEVSLSYDIPEKIKNMLRLSSMQVKLQATNLFLLYADKKLNGQDPEFVNSGGVAAPMSKQFTFTLRLGL